MTDEHDKLLIQVGSVVQIDPDHDPHFGACLLVVTEVKSWGVQGYVMVPQKPQLAGLAFYRVAFEHVAYTYIGQAEWMRGEPEAADAVDPQASSTGTPSPHNKNPK